MEVVYEELDEAKAEIESLRADLKGKAELCANLKKAHNEQLIQIRDANSKIEKQAQELNEKAEEISVVKQKCEDLQCNLTEKESILRCLSTTNDKLRFNWEEKNQKWEEERRGLVFALDEANEKNIDQEKKINVFKVEIEGLKGLLSASQKSCLEAEKKAIAPKEIRDRDDMLLKLEEDNRKVEDQLKWKKEQFKHLEEAYEKLREKFRESKKEWEKEKCTLIDDICSLQAKLDSEIRISKDLQNQLRMCNQALAHEESMRKYLEVEVSKLKTRFENAFTECQEAKSQVEFLTTQRDKEIATLRHFLSMKEASYKETEYQARKLEQENQEFLASFRELQEAQIQKSGNSSLVKLQNKLKSAEQMHRDCSAKLRAKEAEWSSQHEKLNGELNDYRIALESNETALKEVVTELENCHSVIMQLKLQNEEASIMLLVLKSGIAEAELNIKNAGAKLSIHDKEKDESIFFLMKQLETKNTVVAKALADVEEERQKAASLLKRLESLDLVEEQLLAMQKELERYKEMLEESSRCQLHFKEDALQTESELKTKLTAACHALDMANLKSAKEKEKAALLSRKVESMDLIEEKQFLMQKEVERYKEMLEESSRCQLQLEELVLQIETDSEKKLKEVYDALELANYELAEQCEKASFLSKRAESLSLVEEQHLSVQKELQRYKEMLAELSKNQLLLEEKALSMESELKEKLSEACDALDTANSELVKEREKAAFLMKKLEPVDLIEEQQHQMQKDLERCREMLEESSRSQLHMEKEALQKESGYEEKLRQLHDSLDRVNTELTAKICDGHAIEFELWIWKSIAQHFKDDLEENQALRKKLEASLLAQVEFGETMKLEKNDLVDLLAIKDSRIDNLHQQIVLLEQEVASTKMKTAMSFESEKESFLCITREKDKILEDLQKEIAQLEQESLRRELEGMLFAQIGAERTLDQEKENLILLVEERDQRIDDLLQSVKSLEQKFNGSLNSFSSELTAKQADISLLHEAWKKIAAAEILAQIEIEEKKLMIVELEENINFVQQKLELQEKSLCYSKQQADEIEATLEAKDLEIRKLMITMETKLRASDTLVEEFKSEKRNLVEDFKKLLSEREELLDFVAGFNDRISEFSYEDVQLMGTLQRMLQSLDNNGSGLVFKGDSGLLEPVKENMDAPSPTTKRFQVIHAERSPFRELN